MKRITYHALGVCLLFMLAIASVASYSNQGILTSFSNESGGHSIRSSAQAKSNSQSLRTSTEGSGNQTDLAVYVGYADNVHGNGKFPCPWYNCTASGFAPVTNFIGTECSNPGCIDAGAVGIENLGNSPLNIKSVVVSLPGNGCGDDGCLPQQFNLWGNFTIPEGGFSILTQMGRDDFDTSDFATTSCNSANTEAGAPQIAVSIEAGSTLLFNDTNYILNKGRVDPGNCGINESQPWVSLGESFRSPLETFNVSFVESTLPDGTQWGATLGPYQRNTISDSINFNNIQAGTYDYTIEPPKGWCTSQPPTSGELSVNSDLIVPINFTRDLNSPCLSAFLSPSKITAFYSNSTCVSQGQTTLVVRNSGGSNLDWGVTHQNPFLNYSFSELNGTVPANSTQYVFVGVVTPQVPPPCPNYYSDNITVSSTAGNVSLPFIISLEQGNETGLDSLNFQGNLVLNTTSQTYTLLVTITPNSLQLSNYWYFLLNDEQTSSLVQEIYNQLRMDGFSNLAQTEFVLAAAESNVTTMQAVEDGQALLSCSQASFSANRLVTDVGAHKGLLMTTPQIVYDVQLGGGIEATCGGLPPSLLALLEAVTNGEYSSITNTSESQLILPYTGCSSTRSCSYEPEFAVGPDQELFIEVSGLALSLPQGFSVTLSGQNGITNFPIPSVIGNGCRSQAGCYLISPGSFNPVTLTMAQCSSNSSQGDILCESGTYVSGTETVEDPVSTSITTTLNGGLFSQLGFDPATSSLSGQLSIATNQGGLASISFLVPAALDPMGLLNFRVFENNAFVPFEVSGVVGGGYAINATFSQGGSVSLVLPQTIPSLALSNVEGTLIIDGEGFAPSSSVTIEYWNGSTWIPFSGEPNSSGPSGQFFISQPLPTIAQKILFLRATDAIGNFAVGSEILTHTCCLVSFLTKGLDSSSQGLVLTVNGTQIRSTNLPFYGLFNTSTVLNFSYSGIVTSYDSSKRFQLSMSGGNGTAFSSLIVNGTEVIVGNYETQFQVIFEASPSLGGTTTPGGSLSWYDAGTNVTISASPNYGYRFVSWNTSAPSIYIGNAKDESTIVTVNGSGSIVASFVGLPITVTTHTVASSLLGFEAIIAAIIVTACAVLAFFFYSRKKGPRETQNVSKPPTPGFSPPAVNVKNSPNSDLPKL